MRRGRRAFSQWILLMTTPYRCTAAHTRMSTILREAAASRGFKDLAETLVSGVDRRKLSHIAHEAGDTTLSFAELAAIDKFLVREGHGGLSSVFR
jgi:hypothetical protein